MVTLVDEKGIMGTGLKGFLNITTKKEHQEEPTPMLSHEDVQLLQDVGIVLGQEAFLYEYHNIQVAFALDENTGKPFVENPLLDGKTLHNLVGVYKVTKDEGIFCTLLNAITPSLVLILIKYRNTIKMGGGTLLDGYMSLVAKFDHILERYKLDQNPAVKTYACTCLSNLIIETYSRSKKSSEIPYSVTGLAMTRRLHKFDDWGIESILAEHNVVFQANNHVPDIADTVVNKLYGEAIVELVPNTKRRNYKEVVRCLLLSDLERVDVMKKFGINKATMHRLVGRVQDTYTQIEQQM